MLLHTVRYLINVEALFRMYFDEDNPARCGKCVIALMGECFRWHLVRPSVEKDDPTYIRISLESQSDGFLGPI